MKEQHKALVDKEIDYALASFENIQKHLEKEMNVDVLRVHAEILIKVSVILFLHTSMIIERTRGVSSKEVLIKLLELLKEECLENYPKAKENYEALYERTT